MDFDIFSIFLKVFFFCLKKNPKFKKLRGVNWENLAAVQPYMTLDAGNVQSNFVLKYFLTAFLFLVIGLIQIGKFFFKYLNKFLI